MSIPESYLILERSRLTLLPEGYYPEVLVKDPRVKNILPKTGDEMVADWLKIHSNYGTLICSLQNKTSEYCAFFMHLFTYVLRKNVSFFAVDSGNVRCCLYIPADQDQRIILFSRLQEVHKERRGNREGKTPKLNWFAQRNKRKDSELHQ